MSLAKANFEIHFPTILSRMSLVEANFVNTPQFIYIKHNIIVIAFIRKTLRCISVKERENHAPALPVSWPPPTKDPILVAPPKSQRSFWSWLLQAKCYRQSIFIHYTYDTFYACLFSHHNIHTHIKYIFRVSISMCMCPHDSVFTSMKFQCIFPSWPFYMFLLNVDIYITHDLEELISTWIISKPKIPCLLHTCKFVHQFTTWPVCRF